jgi:hypothetical protein
MSMALSLGVLLVLAEVALRLLPVADGPWAAAVNAGQPVFRYEPYHRFLYSKDWNFSLINAGTVNNAGFVNAGDYARSDPRPLLAVIGDSQVEALMVPNAETFHRRLGTALEARGRVYSFAASGAPLSQYLAWARHAARDYGAAGLVIVVIGNDFDESLAAYNHKPGFHLYRRQGDGELELALTDYRPSLGRALVRHAAFARYLVFNLHALETVRGLGALLIPGRARAEPPRYAGYTSGSLDPTRVARSLQAIDAFLRDLPRLTGLASDRVLFLLDGARYEAEIAGVEASYFGLMRRSFRERAGRLGYEVIDLQPLLVAASSAGTRLDFPTDGHWNASAHGLVAGAVAGSALFRRLFAP